MPEIEVKVLHPACLPQFDTFIPPKSLLSIFQSLLRRHKLGKTVSHISPHHTESAVTNMLANCASVRLGAGAEDEEENNAEHLNIYTQLEEYFYFRPDKNNLHPDLNTENNSKDVMIRGTEDCFI